jgi:hypothetical protein
MTVGPQNTWQSLILKLVCDLEVLCFNYISIFIYTELLLVWMTQKRIFIYTQEISVTRSIILG